MLTRPVAAAFALAVMFGLSGLATAKDKAKARPARPAREADGAAAEKEKAAPSAGRREVATFGGGCFWSIEAIFEHTNGVKSAVSGYAGGGVPAPTYEQVCTGKTGHAEAVRVEFDPDVISYEQLLNVFWKAHDPTTLNRQGDDFGPQYRSVLFFHDEAQRLAALKSSRELTERRAFRNPIVTELVPMAEFFPAERYHQDFYRNHRTSDYSLTHIAPKLRKLKSR